MKKLISVLLFFALNLLNINTSASSRITTSLNNSLDTSNLTERLVADGNFKHLSISIYTLITKVQESQTGLLFKKYFEKNISLNELKNLLNATGFTSKDDFAAYLKEIYFNKLEVNRKFPQLNSEINSAKYVIKAGNEIVATELKPTHTTGQCWALFLSASCACMQGCAYWDPNNWESCMQYCMSVVISGSSICFLLAD
jgi:hypothetical protein